MSGVAVGWRRILARAAAVIAAAAMLCWPALWNGLPLLFPDSTEYLIAGKFVVARLRGRWLPHFWEGRSEFYSVGLYAAGITKSVWMVAVLQALLTAWVLWLVVRSIVVKRPLAVYLVLVAALSLLTGVAWYVSFAMPDILGPVLYLCLYLLVFAPQSLQRWEMCGVAVVAWWSVTAHGSHLLVAAALFAVLGTLWLARWRGMQGRGAGVLAMAGILLAAGGSQMLMHQRMYGRAAVFGLHPPFLMARLLGDGPARVYLQQHCSTLSWTICRDPKQLPVTDDGFLWQPDGIWGRATEEQRQQLRQEELPLLWATLRAYPLQQAGRSARNFFVTLTMLGPDDFRDYPIFRSEMVQVMMPGVAPRYERSQQSHNAVPRAMAFRVQGAAVLLSLGLIAWLLPGAWGGGDARLAGLAVVVLFAVVCNAFVTGVLSGISARYEGRVMWMVGLLAGLLLAAWTTRVAERAAGRA